MLEVHGPKSFRRNLGDGFKGASETCKSAGVDFSTTDHFSRKLDGQPVHRKAFSDFRQFVAKLPTQLPPQKTGGRVLGNTDSNWEHPRRGNALVLNVDMKY